MAFASDQPVRLFVRRGALQRFNALKERTANLDVEVSWDRRGNDRRDVGEHKEQPPVSGERRKNDRRRAPSFTWDMADFTVAVTTEADKKQLPAHTVTTPSLRESAGAPRQNCR